MSGGLDFLSKCRSEDAWQEMGRSGRMGFETKGSGLGSSQELNHTMVREWRDLLQWLRMNLW